jgi:hypothetical protein
MIIYHGSPKTIETPLYGYGSKENDYGLGFYCTQSNDLAKEWACPTVQSGFSNKYELDMDGLRVLHLNSDGYHILNWIAILLQNRIFAKRSPVARQANSYILNEFLPDISGYDVVIGYRADDSYFSYAKDFLNNTISVNQLSQAMKLGELGEQVVLISEKAFQQIHFRGYEIADGSIYNPRRMARENRARSAYLSNHGADFSMISNEIYVLDIIREGMKNDDPRLR